VDTVNEFDIASNRSKLSELEQWIERLQSSLTRLEEYEQERSAAVHNRGEVKKPTDSPYLQTEKMKLQLTERHIIVVTAALETAKNKTHWTPSDLSKIIDHYALTVHVGLCERLRKKLPRELRNIIYETICGKNNTVIVNHQTPIREGVRQGRSFVDDESVRNDWSAHFYIDTRLVGQDIATGMVETLY
jgi:hypothetical protein